MNCPIKLGKDKNEIENLLVNFHLFLKLSKLFFQFSVVFNLISYEHIFIYFSNALSYDHYIYFTWKLIEMHNLKQNTIFNIS